MDTLPLSDAIVSVADWMKAHDIARYRPTFAANIEAVKTQAYFQRALWDYTRKFYSNDMDVLTFLDKSIHRKIKVRHGMKECATSDWTRRILRLTSVYFYRISSPRNLTTFWTLPAQSSRHATKVSRLIRSRRVWDLWGKPIPKHRSTRRRRIASLHDLYRWTIMTRYNTAQSVNVERHSRRLWRVASVRRDAAKPAKLTA